MSTAADTPAAPPEAVAKVGFTAILIPVLLSTVVTLAAVGGGVFWLIHSGKLGGGTSAPAAVTVEAKPIPSHVLALEPMVVNLVDGRSYLRAGVSLRVRDEAKSEKKEEAPKDPKAVDGVATALRDTTLTVLSSSTAENLLAPEGRESLKKALESAYKQHNEDAHVLDVYFTEFLVQRG